MSTSFNATRVLHNAVRRRNKRTASSEPTRVLNALISTYHMSPTFAPLDQAKHEPFVTAILAPASQIHQSKPQPTRLHDLLLAHDLVDDQRVKFDQAGTLFNLDLDLPSNHRQQYYQFSNSPLLGSKNKLHESVEQDYTIGEEPFLYKRVRTALDTLHGTSNGGLAGLDTVKDNSDKAREWIVGMRAARQANEQRDRQLELEQEGFEAEFQASDARLE